MLVRKVGVRPIQVLLRSLATTTEDLTPPAKKLLYKPKVNDTSLPCAVEGKALLNSPQFNKGSAFSLKERDEFNLHGLLPEGIGSLQKQHDRAYAQFKSYPSNLSKNEFLWSMFEQNQGEAIEKYSHLFRRPEGCFLSINESPETIEERLRAWGSEEDIDYIVCSDGEGILGIGDWGVGGIGISMAKGVLMTLCGGAFPNRILPIVLDVGTNNQVLIKDPLYLGIKEERTSTEKYYEFMEHFVQAVKKCFPLAVLHFEDFGVANGRRLLQKYSKEMCCFNDDIQGTGAVSVAALKSAIWVTGTKLSEQKIVIFGAGSAGMGICDAILLAMKAEGLSEEDALKNFYVIDRNGLLFKSSANNLSEAQLKYARDDEEWEGHEKPVQLLEVIETISPNVLIGCSTAAGSFNKKVCEAMAKGVERPIIFPLSNPTRLVEADPADINKWTDGKALIATGSPFPPTEHNGVLYEVAECNNALIYPGLGVGCILCRAERLTLNMLQAASKALAAEAPAQKDPDKSLLPDVKYAKAVSTKIALAVIKQAIEDGVARTQEIPENDSDLEQWILNQQWQPEYKELRKTNPELASKFARAAHGVGRTL